MQNEYQVLAHIQDHQDTSQRQISKTTGLSLGAVNLLIKKMARKGLVKVERLSPRTVRYILTPQGLKEKTRLTYNFVRSSYRQILNITNAVERLIEEEMHGNSNRNVSSSSSNSNSNNNNNSVNVNANINGIINSNGRTGAGESSPDAAGSSQTEPSTTTIAATPVSSPVQEGSYASSTPKPHKRSVVLYGPADEIEAILVTTLSGLKIKPQVERPGDRLFQPSPDQLTLTWRHEDEETLPADSGAVNIMNLV